MGHRKAMPVTWHVTDDKSPQIKDTNPSGVYVLANQVVVEWSRQVNSIAAWWERPLSH